MIRKLNSEKKKEVKKKSVFKGLSERALNVLVMNRIDNLEVFLSYHRRFGDFTTLRHCGKKTNTELLDFADTLIAMQQEAGTEQHSENIAGAGQASAERSLKRRNIKSEVISGYHQIPPRPKNVLFMNGIIGAEAFLQYFKDNGDFLTLMGCGNKTNATLIEYAEKLIELLSEEDQIKSP